MSTSIKPGTDYIINVNFFNRFYSLDDFSFNIDYFFNNFFSLWFFVIVSIFILIDSLSGWRDFSFKIFNLTIIETSTFLFNLNIFINNIKCFFDCLLNDFRFTIRKEIEFVSPFSDFNMKIINLYFNFFN
jgi:hypothetical protein